MRPRPMSSALRCLALPSLAPLSLGSGLPREPLLVSLSASVSFGSRTLGWFCSIGVGMEAWSCVLVNARRRGGDKSSSEKGFEVTEIKHGGTIDRY
ncbi:unnamed protein product [Musa banksii]